MLSEKTITHGGILIEAIPIGGLRMVDRGEADDKIIAVIRGDAVYGGVREISELPAALRDRLRHYFLTYKQLPDDKASPRLIEIAEALRSRRGARGDPADPRRLRRGLRIGILDTTPAIR